MIYTFYSFKGGVGRSMALANLGEWLYQQGFRVLMVDWDLEAPGLENFFYESEDKLEAVWSELGVIDLLRSYLRQYPHLPLPPSEEGTGRDLVPVFDEHLSPVRNYLFPIHEPADSTDPALWLLPAGWRSGKRFAKYAEAVQGFDWEDFYRNCDGEAFFEWLRRSLLSDDLSDVILIDSRTGVTEMGGVCTRQLADVVVSMCAPNAQNLAGVARMARSFQRVGLLTVRNDRPLDMLIVPARVDDFEGDKLDGFKSGFLEAFRDFAPEFLSDGVYSFWDLKIPYVPYYAYEEGLAASDPTHASAEKLLPAYRALAEAMATCAFHRRGQHPMARLSPASSRRTVGEKVVTTIYSRNDLRYCDELRKHLSVLGRNLAVRFEEREASLEEPETPPDPRVVRSDVVLLLLSVDLLASPYFLGEEIGQIVERSRLGKTRLQPILVRDCDWEAVDWLMGLEILPKDGKAISRHSNRDAALVEIVQSVRPIVEEKPQTREPAPKEEGRARKVFVSYAHEDEGLARQLRKHLAILGTRGVLEFWDDRSILPGEKWQERISEQLERADVILLLISADFLASEYIWSTELQHALDRQQEGDALVVPVILRPTAWMDTPIRHLQVLPLDGQPVTSWENRDEAMSEIAKELARILERGDGGASSSIA